MEIRKGFRVASVEAVRAAVDAELMHGELPITMLISRMRANGWRVGGYHTHFAELLDDLGFEMEHVVKGKGRVSYREYYGGAVYATYVVGRAEVSK